MILFVDGANTSPYTGNTMREQGMGGSESTLVRIAERMAKDHPVWVRQRGRTINEAVNDVMYTTTWPSAVKHVICLRNPMLLRDLRARYPRARLYLWCTDLFDRNFASFWPIFHETATTLIGVSEFHKEQMRQTLLSNYHYNYPIQLTYINNPVTAHISKENLPSVDINKLIFTSSYIKGLKGTLSLFEEVRRHPELKDLKLYVANPGYLPNYDVSKYENVVMLGSMKPEELYKEMASSLCLFTANRLFPETFGLVFAEANALGVPFIAHPFGALRALYKDPAHNFQLLDTFETGLIAQTLLKWRKNRPVVAMPEEFSLDKVVSRWYNLFKL